MSNVIEYPGQRKAPTARKAGRINPLLAEIIDALLHFNGQAHRDEICNLIASRRVGRAIRASEDLKQEVIETFHSHLASVGQSRRARCLLHLPFGETSHRWALTHDAAQLFGQGRAALSS